MRQIHDRSFKFLYLLMFGNQIKDDNATKKILKKKTNPRQKIII